VSDEQLLLKEDRTWYVAALLCYLNSRYGERERGQETGLTGRSPEGDEGTYWTVVPSKKKEKKKVVVVVVSQTESLSNEPFRYT